MLLRKGSQGSGVSELQRLLNEHGAQPPLKVDGDFGPATERAVRAYQQKRGITVDGIAGDQTFGALRGGGPRKPRPQAQKQAGNRTTASPGNSPTEVSVPMRNLDGLEANFRAKVVTILKELAGKGWKPVVAEGLRTRAQQAEKVRLGYSKTMNSAHLLGLGADIVDRRYAWGGPAANTEFQFWKDLGLAARAQGLIWGGDWKKFKDVAHVEAPRR
ncbi:MAG: hypothetical protein RIT45_3421 [Pseudomonadota bacterium]